MIDLHSHVLPGIDDGTADVSEALELAAAAAAGGTRVLAATPHLRADHPGVRPGELAGRCRELNRRLVEARVPLEIIQGGELDLDWAMATSDGNLRLVSYGGRGTDLLVETPYGSLAADFEKRVLTLARRGFRLLLATHELSAALVREGLAHVLASDAHAAGGPAPPDLAEGVAAALEVAGPRARWMASDAPAAILAGEPLPQGPRRTTTVLVVRPTNACTLWRGPGRGWQVARVSRCQFIGDPAGRSQARLGAAKRVRIWRTGRY